MAEPFAVGVMLITDGFDGSTVARVEATLASMPAGFAAVQLRAKTLSARALVDAGRLLRAVTDGRALLLVNDRVDVALAVGADGVHLPVAGLSAAVVRRLAPSLLVGASTHSVDEAVRADADYVTFGPVWDTPSKGPAVGVEALKHVVRAVAVPVFALGGVDETRLDEVRSAGARPAGIRFWDAIRTWR